MDSIILSAGQASRFGVAKFLLPAGPQHTLLSRAIERALLAVAGQVVVVLGRESNVARYEVERFRSTLGYQAQRVLVAENPLYALGLSTSLKTGLAALERSEGVLVLLADHPNPGQERIASLVDAYKARPIGIVAVAAAEKGEQRPPVILSPVLFPAIMALEGEEGAKTVLSRFPQRLQLQEWGSGEWFDDIDTWEDYRKLVTAMQWKEESPLRPTQAQTSQELERLVLDALSHTPHPWIKPGTLLLAGNLPPAWLQLQSPLGEVKELVTGPAAPPAAYLQLLRTAALALLAFG